MNAGREGPGGPSVAGDVPNGDGAVGWLLLRRGGNVVAADPLGAALIGTASPAELVGLDVGALLAPAVRGALVDALDNALPWSGRLELATSGANHRPLHGTLTSTAAGLALLALRPEPAGTGEAPRRDELEQLLAVHQALDALDDPAAAARSALQATAGVVPHDWSAVLLLDPAEVRVIATYPSAMAGVAAGSRWSPLGPAERELLETREPSLDGLVRDQGDGSPLARLSAFGMASVLRVPLFGGERVVGATLLYAARPAAFGATEGLRLERLMRPLGPRLLGSKADAARERGGERGRMAALGEAVPGAAHELNNPLAAILGYAQIAGTLGDEERAQAIAAIEREAARARRIVHTLLELARPEPSGRGPVSLEAVARRVIEVRRYALSVDNVVLRTHFEPLPPVVADERRLEQALLELLAAAHQASSAPAGAGGSVEVATALVDGRARLSVTDSGPGNATLPSRAGPGLDAARAVAEEHGGRLLVESPPSGGARLVLELPLDDAADVEPAPTAPAPPRTSGALQPQAPALEGESGMAARQPTRPPESPAYAPPPPSSSAPPPATAPPPAAPAAEARRAGARLLVVDDDPTLRTLARELLRAEGYVVELAGSTDEALALLERQPIDLVLTDLQMPGRGGDELYAELRARWPALAARTLFITGDVESDRARRLFSEGGAPYLRKPFLRFELLEAVRSLLAR